MKKITFESAAGKSAHYSAGVVHGGIAYVSGQLGNDPVTGEYPQGMKAQVKQALLNIERVLKAAGTTKENVLQCRAYIPSIDLWGEFNEAYGEFFGDHKPARVVVPVRDLMSGVLVEIEAIAACEE